MNAKPLPSNDELSKLFGLYSSSPSGLIWKNPSSRRVKSGSVAGADNGTGHFQVKVRGSQYLTSRIIYQITNNVVLQACDIVDHIDGNPYNNDSANLRISTIQQNCRNITKKCGISKYRGVSYYPNRTKKWMASITIDSKLTYLGRFETEEEAAKAYDEAARKIDTLFYKTNF